MPREENSARQSTSQPGARSPPPQKTRIVLSGPAGRRAGAVRVARDPREPRRVVGVVLDRLREHGGAVQPGGVARPDRRVRRVAGERPALGDGAHRVGGRALRHDRGARQLRAQEAGALAERLRMRVDRADLVRRDPLGGREAVASPCARPRRRSARRARRTRARRASTRPRPRASSRAGRAHARPRRPGPRGSPRARSAARPARRRGRCRRSASCEFVPGGPR